MKRTVSYIWVPFLPMYSFQDIFTVWSSSSFSFPPTNLNNPNPSGLFLHGSFNHTYKCIGPIEIKKWKCLSCLQVSKLLWVNFIVFCFRILKRKFTVFSFDFFSFRNSTCLYPSNWGNVIKQIKKMNLLKRLKFKQTYMDDIYWSKGKQFVAHELPS